MGLPDESLGSSVIPVEDPMMPEVRSEIDGAMPEAGAALPDSPLPTPFQPAPRHDGMEPIATWDGSMIGSAALVFWIAWELRCRRLERRRERDNSSGCPATPDLLNHERRGRRAASRANFSGLDMSSSRRA
jgi:hypothetical protein